MSSTEINVPNQKFWTITPFRFDLPEGWRARQTVEDLAYMERKDTPSTNCVIRWKRVPAKMELKIVAQGQRKNLKRVDPDMKIGFSRAGLLNGKMAYAHVAEFSMPTGEKKGQYYVAFFGPRLGVEQPIEMFEMIGHFDSAEVGHLEEIQDIVSSFQFNLRPVAVVDDAGDEAKGA